MLLEKICTSITMSFSDIIQRLRSLLDFSTPSTKENQQLKRQADQPPNYSGLTKYRKVNNYFPIVIDKPIEDNYYSKINGYEMGDQSKENGIRRKYILPGKSKLPRKNSFYDFEFSDDEDDIVIPHRNILQQNDHQDSSRNNSIGIIKNKRPVLSEDNYKRSPIIYNIPIQIESRKSNPPPLRDVKTGYLLASTCDPFTMYTPTRSTPRGRATVSNNIKSNDDDIEYISTSILDSRNASRNRSPQSQQRNFSRNDDIYSNIPRTPQSPIANKSQQKSFMTKLINFSNRQEYLKLLEKVVPNIYKTDEKKIDQHKKTLQNSRTKKIPNEVKIDLTIDDDDEIDNQSLRKEINLLAVEDEDEDDIHYDSNYEMSLASGGIKNRSQNQRDNEVSNNDLPYVEPVNSLKEQLNLQPKLRTNWLSDFEGRYLEKSNLRKKQIQEEENNVRKLQEETNRQEKILRERLRNVVLDAEPILLDESDSEDEIEFPEFTREDTDMIKRAIYGPVDEILISKFNINITRRDIETLLGQNWLNDEIINFYMNLLMERSKERNLDGLPKVYAMNTFFLPRLQQSGHAGVSRWTRKVDIFEYDVIPVPVHVGQVHWCMAIIHLKNKSIKYYDSMGTPNPKVIKLLEQYLQDEAFDKKKIRYDTSKFVKESVKDIPRQMNGSDCGVFSCMFAEYITRNKPITFTQMHMEYFRQKMILEICKGKLLL